MCFYINILRLLYLPILFRVGDTIQSVHKSLCLSVCMLQSQDASNDRFIDFSHPVSFIDYCNFFHKIQILSSVQCVLFIITSTMGSFILLHKNFMVVQCYNLINYNQCNQLIHNFSLFSSFLCRLSHYSLQQP